MNCIIISNNNNDLYYILILFIYLNIQYLVIKNEKNVTKE